MRRVGWVLDLDGVVWLGDEPIPGSADAIARLRAAGERLAFVTNNSFGTRSAVAEKLARHGIEGAGDVITSAMAASALVQPDERVIVCGGPGVAEALAERGATVVTDDDDISADVVVVGYDPGFDYARMKRAAQAVRGGARLIATNDDATYPTPEGLIPGAGSILASVVTASGATPEVAGKPHRPMVDVVRAHLGEATIVVGDRPDTDGRFASAMGVPFGLVLSGVIGADDLPVTPEPQFVAADLAGLVRQRFDGG
jgi:HAD superfamily hydrolase (TIGR01450 family)